MFFNNFIISKIDCMKSKKKHNGTDNSAIHEGRFNKLPVVLPLKKES